MTRGTIFLSLCSMEVSKMVTGYCLVKDSKVIQVWEMSDFPVPSGRFTTYSIGRHFNFIKLSLIPRFLYSHPDFVP